MAVNGGHPNPSIPIATQEKSGGCQGNRISIGPSFSTDRNAAFLALVNSGFCEESRLKDALKN